MGLGRLGLAYMMSTKSKKTNKGIPPPKGKPVTLMLLVEGEMVLLGMKKKGFGQGKWNGIGGKVEEGETIEQAAIRETQEEIGVTPKEISHVATIHYMPYDITMFVYMSKTWEGIPIETEEMAPQWFKKSLLPEHMWESDTHWMPKVLKGVKIKGKFVYDTENNLLEKVIEEG